MLKKKRKEKKRKRPKDEKFLAAVWILVTYSSVDIIVTRKCIFVIDKFSFV